MTTEVQELTQALAGNPEAQAIYTQLPPSHQQEYQRWNSEAKKPETRQKRAEQAVRMLLDKRG